MKFNLIKECRTCNDYVFEHKIGMHGYSQYTVYEVFMEGHMNYENEVVEDNSEVRLRSPRKLDIILN